MGFNRVRIKNVMTKFEKYPKTSVLELINSINY